jgi:hypothetical protein
LTNGNFIEDMFFIYIESSGESYGSFCDFSAVDLDATMDGATFTYAITVADEDAYSASGYNNYE